MRQYVLFEEWYNDYHQSYIGYARTEDKKHAGENFVGRGGSEGMHIYVYDSLIEALDNCLAKIKYVDFGKLNKEDQKILEDYKEKHNIKDE